MSVSPETFEIRNNNRKKYVAIGCLELKDLTNCTIVSIAALEELGLLKERIMMLSTDLSDHDLTKEGEKYFIEKEHQLIIARPEKITNLILLTKELIP